MTPAQPSDSVRRETLKRIIRSLHDGRSVDEVKREFAGLLGSADSSDIAALEEALMAEGMPDTEIKRLCDVHVAVFEESLNEKAQSQHTGPAPAFLTALQQENTAADRALALLEKTAGSGDWSGARDAFAAVRRMEDHYRKKENRLFPRLERKGFSAPAKVMWAVHDDIRGMWKKLDAALAGDPSKAEAPAQIESLARTMRDMAYKEENILFPNALRLLSAEDWAEMLAGEAGYRKPAAADGLLSLAVGALSAEQVNLLLTHLPVDVTFVDENDSVRYYSAGRERIFERTPDVIGRKVQLCHPPASLHRVQRILDEFRAGTLETAEFWIHLGPPDAGGKFVHIRYFAMRDGAGAYRGALEVTQEISGIRALQGERRLLDE